MRLLKSDRDIKVIDTFGHKDTLRQDYEILAEWLKACKFVDK